MYTQYHGEIVSGTDPTDMVLRSYFPDFDYQGTIIEVGGYDPIVLSNSYHFEQNGWLAYCIEANNLDFEKFASRKHALNFACAEKDEDNVSFDVVTSSGWTAGFSALELDPNLVAKCDPNRKYITNEQKILVNVRKLDTLLETVMTDVKNIDILTIDVEGAEMRVLQGFNIEKWAPKILFIEDHFYESGNLELFNYITSRGYRLDKSVLHNYFYVKN